MTTELVPDPFFHLLSLSHVPIVATRSDEPTSAIAIADVVTRLLRHRASCLSGDAPLGHNDSVCHAAFATFHTNPAAGAPFISFSFVYFFYIYITFIYML
jgi:hypothetical protein